VGETWLTLTKEAPIAPDLPICDAHHHLWDRPNDRYLLEEFLRDIAGGHNVVKTVFVGCKTMYRENGPQEMRPVGETEFVRSITVPTASDQYGITQVACGIVGFADLTLGTAVAPVLEAHIAAGKGRFRGIRQVFRWHARPDIRPEAKTPKSLSDLKLREGFACLEKYGLSFDAWQTYSQLTELATLARAFPNTTIVVNHIGGALGIGPLAEKREEVLMEWQRGVTALASCPNVVIKLGGLGMRGYCFGWHEQASPPSSVELAKAMAPHYLWCIEQFGVDRCMFESNFPVDKLSYSYTVMWNAFKRIVKDFSTNDRAALFHDTAVKVYRLTR